MAGLQRSGTTFRRSGSSGLVWDERFLSTEADDAEAKAARGDGAAGEPQPELRHSRSVGSFDVLRRGGDRKKKQAQKEEEEARRRSNQRQAFRTKDVAPDVVDPPSPRVSGCILCAIFGSSGGSAGSARRRSKPSRKK